jgi:hypothetical protein
MCVHVSVILKWILKKYGATALRCVTAASSCEQNKQLSVSVNTGNFYCVIVSRYLNTVGTYFLHLLRMKQTRRYAGSLLNDEFSVDYIGAMTE